jgi:chaperonin GroES
MHIINLFNTKMTKKKPTAKLSKKSEAKLNTKTATKTAVPIKPLHDRVILIEVAKGDNKTASGIIIPDSADESKDTKRGEVVAVGVGRLVEGKLEKPAVSVGDRVIYSWGDEVVVQGKKYTIVGADNISAIIN